MILKRFARYKTYLAEHDGNAPETIKLLRDLALNRAVDTDESEISGFLTLLREDPFTKEGKKRKKSTLDGYECVLRSFYRYLADQNVIDANPMQKNRLPAS